MRKIYYTTYIEYIFVIYVVFFPFILLDVLLGFLRPSRLVCIMIITSVLEIQCLNFLSCIFLLILLLFCFVSEMKHNRQVMNKRVPDWNMDDDSRYFREFPTEDHHNSSRREGELVELLWQNGSVVMHSQNHKNATSADLKQQVQRVEQSLGESSTLIQEHETASCFQYPMDDCLEKDFTDDFMSDMANAFGFSYDKASKDAFAGREGNSRISSNNESNCSAPLASVQQKDLCDSAMAPPQLNTMHPAPQAPPAFDNDSFINFLHPSRSAESEFGSFGKKLGDIGLGEGTKVRGEDASVLTVVGSNISGSNQLQASGHQNGTSAVNVTVDVAAGGEEEIDRDKLLSEIMQRSSYEFTGTSSSGGSGSSMERSGQQSLSNQKRKERDLEDLEYQSEDAEHESVRVTKPSRRSTSTRRSRAAEVHNQSERRRRDRINEKMKALQDLIPHCNKTDKASMLDEATEYLKSLQMQIQMMWMGGGLAPMMFPGVGQYMPSMGMGMHYASLPSLHNPVQLPVVPFINQSVASALNANQAMLFPSPAMNGASFPNQMQNIHLPESYPHYLGFHQIQPRPQAINFYANGPRINQQNQSAGTPNSRSIMPITGGGGAAPENIGAKKKKPG